ncbi:hypothetical protein [Sphingomonas colocasiae]|uniref:Lipoprotein n=1 Tax=Sphingomonas colocasiae TaxID=1848973 RepID=A0ABS7Q0Z5_9SPHN|nr:hypothetical protein [Sphingomonas colocasiae]MBY8825914.1 hypothetical protein [Sphingomonas colocasiae]
MRASLLALAAPLALLAGCGGGDDAGTSISIKGNDTEGKPATAIMDGGTGAVKIDVPGFEASIKLPKVQLDADNFDIGGVKLYPGSKVTAMNIDAAKKGETKDSVTIAFDSPADAATVKAWFLEKMKAESFTVAEAATGLSGKTDDGNAFTLTLTQGAAGSSTGSIAITE